ncbi:hypothetical protein CVIRNUC_006680 [Coccomyxa viridis]|uniref:Major facilitator superfamily (MFS) profile domain-containing protein n=1 Tax=Coccomyxa viridis TaxID=1274662 RepID=A0AAV1I807_9CHLO|nr:hypothetical protein CVIRNUC_006680 [Coccomyxa viridis]
MDRGKPDIHDDFERCDANESKQVAEKPIKGSVHPLPEGVQTLGQYMVGNVLTRKDTVFSWIGVAVMFFVVMIPTVNQTILAYFTTELKQDCGLTIAQYGLLSGYANGLVYAFASLILGYCVDHLNWPRTWLLVAANVLLAGMYVLEGMATNFGMLLAAVMIAAVGGSVHLTMSVSLVSDLLPPNRVSLGQAFIFTGEAVAVVLAGNLSYAFKSHGISWRAAPLGLAVAAFLVAVAIAVLIREPKKGCFIVQKAQANGGSGAQEFKLGEALAYMANMRTFWMITVGLGIRMNAGHLVLGYMPPFQAIMFPKEAALDATFATIVGVFAFLSSVIIGAICEMQIQKRPWMALYTGAFGGVIGGAFFVLSIWARPIAKQHSGYALMLVCVALGALFANGATGPLAALMTLILPPEIKSFGLSVFEFVSFLLGPMYSVVMAVGLQAISARNQKRYSGVSIDGTGPSSKLTANKRTLVAACIMLAIGLVAALVGGAIFFLWASWGIRHDIAKQKRRADGTAEAERVPRRRKVLLWLGIALLLVLVFFLLIISLIASFNPNTVQSQHHG